MDTTGRALLVLMSDHARQRQASPPIYSSWLHVAERNSPELARRIRALNRAQQELDDYVLSLATPKVEKST